MFDISIWVARGVIADEVGSEGGSTFYSIKDNVNESYIFTKRF